MTNRERAMNLLHYKAVDRMPAVHFGYWSDLIHEWGEQGKIPKELAENHANGNEWDRKLDKLIGWDFGWCPAYGANNSLYPHFETKVLEVLPDGMQRVQNASGMIEKVRPGVTSIPSEDDYLLKDRDAFESLYREKMKFFPERVDTEFFKTYNKEVYEKADYPIAIALGSVLGDIRSMVSVVGMSYLQIMWHIVLPQAFRTAFPPLFNSLIGMVKDTSLASNITIMEMLLTTRAIIARTYEPLALYLEVGFIYLIFCTVLTKIQAYGEKRLGAYTKK